MSDYVAPDLIDLNDSAIGFGADHCKTGSTPLDQCQTGGTAIGKCQTGSIYT